MNPFDLFLAQYGLIAIFLLVLAKYAGVPIPIPADVIILAAAASTSMGRFVLWQAFIVILVAIVLGGLIQFLLARGPGRRVLYRFGRYLGLTPTRLDAASRQVKKGGIIGISAAVLVPGLRGVFITACGLADLPLQTFLSGLLIGSILFLCIHFSLGYLGGSLFSIIGRILPLSTAIPLILLLFIAAYLLWRIAFQRQRSERQEAEAASLELWHEGMCPICLALYTASQLPRSPIAETVQLSHEKEPSKF